VCVRGSDDSVDQWLELRLVAAREVVSSMLNPCAPVAQ